MSSFLTLPAPALGRHFPYLVHRLLRELGRRGHGVIENTVNHVVVLFPGQLGAFQRIVLFRYSDTSLPFAPVGAVFLGGGSAPVSLGQLCGLFHLLGNRGLLGE